MIRRDRNHPSIILWSVGNELEIQYDERFYSQLEEMCAACREQDPTRPVSLALIGFCTKDFNDETPLTRKLDAALRYAEIVDVFMGNYMENYYQVLRDAGMKKPTIGSEVFSYYRHADLTTTAILARSPWTDVEAHSWVCGGFVWAGIDYLGESSNYLCKGWSGCPIDSAGFHKLRSWHLRAQWSSEPVVKIGIYDEQAPWDMAAPNWSFSQMSAHWSFKQRGRMMHVAVMTNCKEIRLYLNEEFVRVAKPDAPDRMAHFYVPFSPGELRAIGYVGGMTVAEDRLKTAEGPHRIELKQFDPLRADGRSVAHVEATLLDEHGRTWTIDSPEIHFDISGGAILLAVDNGDLIGDHDVYGGHCPLHLGHALAYLQATEPGGGKIVVRCLNMEAALDLICE